MPILERWARKIVSTYGQPSFPTYKAEITRLKILLAVEWILGLNLIAFSTTDWIAGGKFVGILEAGSGVFFLLVGPLFRTLFPKSRLLDWAELIIIALVLWVEAAFIFPIDNFVIVLILIYPPLAALIARGRGWAWSLGFLPPHFLLLLWKNPRALSGLRADSIIVLGQPAQSSYLVLGTYSLYLIITLLVFATVSMLEDYRKAWQEAASIDPLTGLFSRTTLREVYEKNKISSSQRGIFIIIMDLDNFKEINDKLGHLKGDHVLREIGRLLSTYTRDSDIVFRWGGEEFLILAPNSDLEGTKALAERLRERIEEHDFGIEFRITASFGICNLKGQEALEQAIAQADKALYTAKEKGKNRVEIYENPIP